MKKILMVLVAVVFVAGITGMASAAIQGTKHDFSSGGDATGQGYNMSTEICNVCHAPHNPVGAANGPLWNHTVTGETFSTYTSPTGTLDASLGAPGGVSKLCLSCHDGVTSIDAFGGGAGTTAITGTANLSNDLSNDHPISFSYDGTLAGNDGELSTPASGVVGTDNLPLFGVGNDQMECASCHDAHGTGNAKFLRVDNADSALCLNCHTK